MIFIREINLSFKLLERIYRQSRHHQVRQRAHCNISFARGQNRRTKILKSVIKRSITGLIDGNQGMIGLYNKPGRGCKPTFNLAQKKKIREWTKQEPKQLKQVLQKVKKEWGIKVSTKTIQRIQNAFHELASHASRC